MENHSPSSHECQDVHRDIHRVVRDTLDVVSGKWKLVILAVLLEDKQRFKELSRKIGISPRILSKELQELERNQLVTRTVCDTRPVTVEYAATAHAHTLGPVVRAMYEWGTLHHATVIGPPQPQVPAREMALAD